VTDWWCWRWLAVRLVVLLAGSHGGEIKNDEYGSLFFGVE